MRTFLLIATTLLGLLHYYIGSRLLPALDLGEQAAALAWAMLALSVLLIPASLIARHITRPPLADRLTWAGSLAMGLFSSVLVLTALRDLALLLAAEHLPAAFEALSAQGVLALAVLVTLAGFINARRTASVVTVDVPLANLPDALHGFTIAQISDIHVGPTIKRGYLDRIVDRVNTLKPDLIAVTGDLVDGSVHDLAPHTEPLKRLAARYGAYFVTGNHEYYSNAHAWIAEVERLGVKVLMNEHVVLDHGGARLVVAGVTDYTAHQFDPRHRSDPLAALAGAPADAAAKVLLAHQPRSAEAAADAGFDLQLSGHTHGGQFFPWNLFVPLQQPFTAGLHKLRDLWVYTSRGTGYWGPPKRFGAPSEITRLRLVRA
ncbi:MULTISPECIES: metallophosphoesterase [Niveibacterium]|uniref:Metallophosphoesterase n=1 Tax=Niveibacterium microcysteis TaxID=2811415 RepID=A0ABX7M520_9RHOO|nr:MULTISPECIES: metallophosphoesterase [Niveibacterium]QSI76865.1 metallophosphoesterase [Niveibacterium microcysteis]